MVSARRGIRKIAGCSTKCKMCIYFSGIGLSLSRWRVEHPAVYISSRAHRFLPPIFFGVLGTLCAEDSPQRAGTPGNAGFAQPLPGSSGFAAPVGFDEAEDLLAGLAISASASSFYDSNLNQSAGTAADPKEDDFVQSLSSSLRWARNSALWNLSLGMLGSYELPLTESDLASFNYGFNGSAGYQAGRLKLALNLNQSISEGSNRFAAAVVRQLSYGVGLSAAYEYSPKTSLVSTYNTSWSDGGSGVSATGSRSANLSAMWRYSPLLQFGPGVSYSDDGGDSLDDRTTIGPTVSANYQFSRKVSVNGRIGWEFVNGGDSSDEGSSPSLSTSIAAAYAMNRFWGFNLSLNRGVEAEGLADAGFRESTALQFSVNRRLGRANAVLGVGYDHTRYLDSAEGGAGEGIDYLNSSLSVSMPFFGDRASATVFLRYNDSISDDPLRNWDGMQTGVSLNYQF